MAPSISSTSIVKSPCMGIVLAAGWMAASCAPAWADSAGLCLQLYYSKAYTRAIAPCQLAGQAGNSHAQYVLGVMYADGLGVEKNSAQANHWYGKAAAQGNAVADYKLQALQADTMRSLKMKNILDSWQRSETVVSQPATALPSVAQPVTTTSKTATPVVVPSTAPVKAPAPNVTAVKNVPAKLSDKEKLFRRYMSEAKTGNSHARYLLGLMFHEGVGVEKDDLQAIEMFMLAARQGLPEAQSALGLMYYQGVGVKRNLGKAKRWLNKAARRGDANAQYCLGLIYADSGSHKGEVEAATWWRRAARQGHAQAQHNLAVLYLKGAVPDNDGVAAMEWFVRAAEHGGPELQFNLARIYSESKGVVRSGGDAANWYFRAGEAWLKQGDIKHAKVSVDKIRQLANNQLLSVPNAFLADVLDKQIQQASSGS
ncbi:hypothetical protein [Mariprofundus ferrooxydans]|nr:hypothetical protein [Mariprofundus ferrooxydans]